MSFSEESLIKKFQDLNNTQQSVQTLSLWLIHHRKNAKIIVSIWLKELLNETKSERKLTFIYLANDILQNSRKKGQEYQNEFTINILLEAIQNTTINGDSKIRFTLERILNIWKDRKIFSDKSIEQFKNALHNPNKVVIDNLDDNILRSPTATTSTPPTSNSKIEINKKVNNKSPTKHLKQQQQQKLAAIASSDEDDDLIKKKRKLNDTPKQVSFVSTTLKDEITKDLLNNFDTIKVPDALELIGMLHDLEKSASSDAIVRQKIAELPANISDLNYVNKIKDEKDIIDFNRKLNDSLILLDDYNKRLNEELITRKRTALLLTAFIKEQQKQLENDKQLLDDWNLKFKQVDNVKNELKIHLKSLPDLKIIDQAAELSPLPTANDLFSN